MEAWIIWLILSGIFFILEIFTVSFMMFWPGVAAFISTLLAIIGLPTQVQIIVFSILSILLIVFTKPLTKKLFKSSNVNTNIDNVIGKEGLVIKEIDNLNRKGQVKVDGEIWTAISSTGDKISQDLVIKVVGVDGVKLIVEKV